MPNQGSKLMSKANTDTYEISSNFFDNEFLKDLVDSFENGEGMVEEYFT